MEIIDCLCGVGPWQRHDPLLPWKSPELLSLMEHFGIASALVHSNFTDGGGACLRGNDHIVEACAADARFMPMFTLCPYWHDEGPTVQQQMAGMREAGGRAMWFFPTQGSATTWIYGEVLGCCERQRVPVFVGRDRINPNEIGDILTEFPDLNLVLSGINYLDDWWLFPLLKLHPTLHVCSGHVYIPADGPMRFLRHFSADRLLFGSGLPHYSPGGMVAHFMYADISEEDRRKILSGNVKRLLEEVRS
jgi:predicted TIM-barrel fold metal-dependent hydrolase